MSAADAFRELQAVLKAVPGVRVTADMAAKLDPPFLVVSPPKLTYDAYRSTPTEATFQVPLVVAGDERAAERLLDLLPAVEQVIYDSESAVLTDAVAGSWGNPSLPCFLLTIEVAV